MKRKPAKVFISYSPKDDDFRIELVNHLKILEYSALINIWDASQILGGDDSIQTKTEKLESADIILLLVSSSYIASDTIRFQETLPAIKKLSQKNTLVIPIILRPVDWKNTPFGFLQALPEGEKPITTWENQDEAFEYISRDIKRRITSNIELQEKGGSNEAELNLDKDRKNGRDSFSWNKLSAKLISTKSFAFSSLLIIIFFVTLSFATNSKQENIQLSECDASDFNFKIFYNPKIWQCQILPNIITGEILSLIPEDDLGLPEGQATKIVFYQQDIMPGEILDKILNSHIKSIEKTHGVVREISRSRLTVNNHPAHQLVFETSGNDQNLKFSEIFIAYEYQLHIISYQTNPSEYEDFKDEFNGIIESVEFDFGQNSN